MSDQEEIRRRAQQDAQRAREAEAEARRKEGNNRPVKDRQSGTQSGDGGKQYKRARGDK